MDLSASSSFAPDMGRFVLRLPVAQIVLLSWIVSEYDGLGFVKTENAPSVVACASSDRSPAERNGCVSLFFPEERRDDVLELLRALRNEGVELEFLFEKRASCAAEDPAKASTLEDFDTI